MASGTPSTRRITVLRCLLVGSYLVIFGLVQVLVMTAVHLVLYLGVMGWSTR